MKIYTKTGDEGLTSLFSGTRVPKNHSLIEAYGTVDEVNCLLGILLCEPLSENLKTLITRLQHELFDLGADLATPLENNSSASKIKRIQTENIERLETEIDQMQAILPPLKEFILPGGSKASAILHFARTVTRRAERALIDPSIKGLINPKALIYLNRLSDWLFVIARLANFEVKRADITWNKNFSSSFQT
ncbi:MAG: cob(I)yrinic acid a,c-diamide adenosyltransferase [Bdellovibrionales bacterium]|nr:cob(I)yrinic acid a,c-diamide adenosyltransferase [Bdellovibrionales bacterium]